MVSSKKKMVIAMICGILGCICFGAGDWLMMYGDTAHSGSVYWLTEGVANISAWRNSLAMALSFPGMIFYGIALFAMASYIINPKQKRIYQYLTSFGMTPWLSLHLFYIMILYLFAWMTKNGYTNAALPVSEALFSHLSWLPSASMLLMIPPFVYWFYLQIRCKTVFPKWMEFTNVLIIYTIMYAIKSLMPATAFRMGFTNGLMSESMIIWYGIMLIYTLTVKHEQVKQATEMSCK